MRKPSPEPQPFAAKDLERFLDNTLWRLMGAIPEMGAEELEGSAVAVAKRLLQQAVVCPQIEQVGREPYRELHQVRVDLGPKHQYSMRTEQHVRHEIRMTYRGMSDVLECVETGRLKPHPVPKPSPHASRHHLKTFRRWSDPARNDPPTYVGDADGGTIFLAWQGPDPDDVEYISNFLAHEVTRIRSTLRAFERRIDAWRDVVLPEVRHAVLDRQRLLARREQSAALMPFPLNVRAEVERVTLPEERRPVVLKPRRGGSGGGLTPASFDEVVKILNNARVGLERSPLLIRKLIESYNENTIRDLLLVFLNDHFDGAATGETFNGEGKTDILVRNGNTNVFVGECKIYGSPSSINEGIDQLLGYLTVRETSGCMLVFARTPFTTAVDGSVRAIRKHPSFVGDVRAVAQGSGRFRLHSTTDPSLEVDLELIVFGVRQ